MFFASTAKEEERKESGKGSGRVSYRERGNVLVKEKRRLTE